MNISDFLTDHGLVITLVPPMGQIAMSRYVETDMAINFGLTAAALSVLSISVASACDDFDDAQALAAAKLTIQVRKAEASQTAAADNSAAATLPVQLEATNVATVQKPTELQSTASFAGAVRQ